MAWDVANEMVSVKFHFPMVRDHWAIRQTLLAMSAQMVPFERAPYVVYRAGDLRAFRSVIPPAGTHDITFYCDDILYWEDDGCRRY